MRELRGSFDMPDHAGEEYRRRIRADYATLHAEHETITARLAELADDPAPGNDLDLVRLLPEVAAGLDELPADLQAELFAAFDIQIVWNATMRQATIHATITDTTPGIVKALLARATGSHGPATSTAASDSATTSTDTSTRCAGFHAHPSCPRLSAGQQPGRWEVTGLDTYLPGSGSAVPREQQRPHQLPEPVHQPWPGGHAAQRRAVLHKYVAQSPRQNPVGGDLVSDHHPRPRKAAVRRDPQRFARRRQVDHSHAVISGQARRAAQRIRGKAHNLHAWHRLDLAEYQRNPPVKGRLAAIPVRDQGLDIKDDCPCRQLPRTVEHLIQPGEALIPGSHAATSACMPGSPPAPQRVLSMRLPVPPSPLRGET